MLDGVFVVLVDCWLSLNYIESKFGGNAPFFNRLVLIHGLAKREDTDDDTEEGGQNITTRIRPFLCGVVNFVLNELTTDVERIGIWAKDYHKE